jgi:DNA-binding NtrC family response regulator
MSVTTPNQRSFTSPRGWISYALARSLNTLSWRLEQILFVGANLQKEVQQASRDLTPLIRALLEEPVAARAEIALLEALDNWKGCLGREDIGDWIDETTDYYSRMASGRIPNRVEFGDFDDLTGMGIANVHTIRDFIYKELDSDEYLQAAFRLGDTIDRGVRPPELAKIEAFNFESINKTYWKFKRTIKSSDSYSRFHEEWRSYRESCERYANDWGDESISQPQRPHAPRPPKKNKVDCRLSRTRRTALEPTWGPKVRIAWNYLKMPVKLPQAVLAYQRKPDFRAYGALISQINRVAWEGFAQLEGLVGSSRQLGNEWATETVRCEPDFSLDEGNYTASGLRDEILTIFDIDQDFFNNKYKSLTLTDSGGSGSESLPSDPRSTGSGFGSIQFAPDAIVSADKSEPDFSGRPKEGSSDPLENVASSQPIPSMTSAGSDDGRGASGLVLPATERQRLREIKKRINPDGSYVGESLAMLRVFEQIDSLNKSFPDKSVLILGPTGVGKTKIAALIHRHSGRPLGKFRREQAADNSLGDFTAVKGRWLGYGKDHGFHNIDKKGSEGIIQEFAGGTVFLDEVADVPIEFQGFLRLILDGTEIPPTTGQGPPIQPSVRLILATNKDLDAEVRAGNFKDDLLDRIKRRSITIPALRDRKEDIFSFVNAKCASHRPTFEFLLALLRYDWPGNVRELLDVLSATMARVHKERERLKLDHLQLKDTKVVQQVRSMSSQEVSRDLLSRLALTLQQRGFERGKKGLGLQVEMARILNLTRPTLTRLVKNVRLWDEDDEQG